MRTYPPATHASFISGIPRIHHNDCGGRIWLDLFDPYSTHNDDFWRCEKCRQSWRTNVMRRFSESDLALRFHLRGDIDMTGHSLVWKVDKVTGKRHTALVPNSLASQHELVKF